MTAPRRPPAADRPARADRAALERRRRVPHRVLQRTVDELPGRRAVLHRRRPWRHRDAAARGGGALPARAAKASSARRRPIGASTPGSTSTSRARATSTPGKGGSSAARAPRRCRPEARHRDHRRDRALHGDLRRASAGNPAALAGTEGAPRSHAVVLACGRGVRAPEHGLRAVPRARRQPGVAPALDADVTFSLQPTCCARPCATCGTTGVAALEYVAERRAFPLWRRRAGAAHLGPWRAYFRADFHPMRPGGERGAPLVDHAGLVTTVQAPG